MDYDERVAWLFDDIVEIEGLSWSIQIWVIAHDFKESGWLDMVILWDDGEWLVMIEWADFHMALMIIAEHSEWELSHYFREVDMTMLYGC